MSKIIEAIYNNDIDTLKFLIDQGAEDINAIYKGRSPLGHAVDEGNVDIVKLLVANGAMVNTKTDSGYTALMLVTLAANLDGVKLLIEKDANVDAQAPDGYTALILAAQTGNLEIIKLLIEKEPDVNVRAKNAITPIIMAAHTGNLEIAKLLIEKGARVNTVIKELIALVVAVQQENLAMVELLIDNGAQVNDEDERGNTALRSAVKIGNLEVVNFLIEKEADVDAEDLNGLTALMYAIKYNHIEIVKFLIERESDPAAIVNAVMPDLYTFLAHAVESNNIEMMEFLIDKGANVNGVMPNGSTFLAYAIENKNEAMIEFLIDKVKNINAVSEDGTTALMHAALAGNFDIAERLIDKGANVDDVMYHAEPLFIYAVKNRNLYMKDFSSPGRENVSSVPQDGITALICAVLAGKLDIAKLLIKKKSAVNYIIPYGYDLLVYAIKYKKLDVVKFLIENNVNVNMKISSGYYKGSGMLTYALECSGSEDLDDKSLAIVKLLVDAGADPFNMVASLPYLRLLQGDKEKIINMFRTSNNIKAIAAAVSMVSANKPLLMQLSPETGPHDVSFAREELDKVKQYFEDNSIATPIPTYNEASSVVFSEALSKSFNEALQEIQKIISQKIMADPETTEQFKELVQEYAKENKTESEEVALRDQLRSQLNHNDANQKAFEWLMTFKRHMININNPDSINAKVLMQEMVVYIVACRNNLLEAGKSTTRSIDIEEALINQLHNLMQANDDLASCVDGTPRGLRGVLEFYLTMVKPKTSLELETEQLHKSVETLIKNMLWQEWEEIIQTHKERAANNAESINWPALKQELIRACEAIVTLGLDNYSRASSAELLDPPDEAISSYMLDENLLGRSTHEPYDKERLELRRKIMYEKRYPTEDAFINAVLNHMRGAGNPEIELSEQSHEYYLRQMYIAVSNYNIRNEVYGYLEGDKEVEGILPSILKKLEDEKLVYQIQEAPYKLAKLLPIKTNLNPVELAKTKNNIRTQLLIIIKDLVKQNKLPIHGDLANDVADDVMQALEQMPPQPAAILRHLQAAIDNHLEEKLASPKEAVPDSIFNLAGRILKFNTTPHDMNHKRDAERLHIKNDLISIIKQIDPSEAYGKAIAIIGTVLKKDNETISTDWSNIDKIDQYLRSSVQTTQPSPKPNNRKPSM